MDDIDDYVLACLTQKKCVICGKPADLHHCEAVGMGRNRKEIIHEGIFGDSYRYRQQYNAYKAERMAEEKISKLQIEGQLSIADLLA